MRDSSYFGYQKYNMIGVITLTTVLTETLSSTKLTQGATQKRQILSTVPNTDKYSQEFHITLYAEIVMQKKKKHTAEVKQEIVQHLLEKVAH